MGKIIEELLSFWKYQQECKGTSTLPPAYFDAIATCAKLQGKVQDIKFENSDEAFLKKTFEGAEFEKLTIEPIFVPLLSKRFQEAHVCKNANAHLACIILCGSILEGLLLGIAVKNPKSFNTAQASPKFDEKVKQFNEWSLSQFIDVAHEIGFISLDVKKFSHSVRDFRNYIHPYQQMSSGFNPDKHTAEICLHVVRAAVASLAGSRGE